MEYGTINVVVVEREDCKINGIDVVVGTSTDSTSEMDMEYCGLEGRSKFKMSDKITLLLTVS